MTDTHNTTQRTEQFSQISQKVRVLKIEGRYAELGPSKIDLEVLSALRKNKAASATFLAAVTKLKERDIEKSFAYWCSKGKVIRSGSYPARYTTNKKIMSVTLDTVDYEQTPYQYGLTVYFYDESHETRVSDATGIFKKYRTFMSHADLNQLENCESS